MYPYEIPEIYSFYCFYSQKEKEKGPIKRTNITLNSQPAFGIPLTVDIFVFQSVIKYV